MKDIRAQEENVMKDPERPGESYFAFIPDKWDFTSAAGMKNFQEGVYVLDFNAKRVVPLNDCNWSWSAAELLEEGLFGKIVERTARSGTTYRLTHVG